MSEGSISADALIDQLLRANQNALRLLNDVLEGGDGGGDQVEVARFVIEHTPELLAELQREHVRQSRLAARRSVPAR